MVRRVKQSEISDSGVSMPAVIDANAISQLYASLAACDKELKSCNARCDETDSEIKTVWKSIVTLQKLTGEMGKSVQALKQYSKDHDELHRNMSRVSGDSQKDLMKLVRNVIAQTDIVQQAVKQMVNRPTDVNVKMDAAPVIVNVPETEQRPVEVTIERGPWKAKLNRDNRGVTQDIDLIPK